MAPPRAERQVMSDYLAQLPYSALLRMCEKHALLPRELLQRLLAQHFASPPPSPAPGSPPPSEAGEDAYRSAH
ncbi:hypothetical protein BASA81_006760 [Batrachochytrium salamandrivorans]|nr:hypothetical protein BASA81_006760 [Batrachochytrium salamandrivorans]